MMEKGNNKIAEFIQANSPDGGFLQSEEWRLFQESAGRKTFHLEGVTFWANIIEHQLPVIGKYFYIPRGPIIRVPNLAYRQAGSELRSLDGLDDLVILATKEKAGWVRIDPASNEALEIIRKNTNLEIQKAPHDMQPQEVFIIDISKSEEGILASMKSKTRYNIRLAEKKGVQVRVSREKNDVERFCDLVEVTAKRDGITAHPRAYYQKMVEKIPTENLQIYLAEFDGKIIAANLMIFFGDTATYLHGSSDNEHRNVMAPYLLQWQAMQDAKKAGCMKYDFGGVKTEILQTNNWAGITKFKTGFAPATQPIKFPGSFDIILNPWQYQAYRIIQRLKSFLK
jgi:lipid II:glycine glycyltransferase (peptidoglycan interpeptide bridge formation enzyme)